MKGSRHSAANRAAEKQARQNRLSRASQARKQRPNRRILAQEMQQKAQQAATSRAQAAAAAQKRPGGMQGPRADSLPVNTAGLEQAIDASSTLDFTAPSGGRGSMQGGAGGGGIALSEENGFWKRMSPLHKALAIGAGFFLVRKFLKKK
tara:strand:- start:79 stop:525 length:447 start_codon:yes stop_codon:yes gene_type:complete